MKCSEFVFDYVPLLYHNCHKVNSNRDGSYTDSTGLIKKQKATIKPINEKDNKSFQYAITVALNNEKIGKHAEKITKIKLFINKCKHKEINFPLEKDDWKEIVKNNVTIALNVLYMKKEKNIYCLCFKK